MRVSQLADSRLVEFKRIIQTFCLAYPDCTVQAEGSEQMWKKKFKKPFRIVVVGIFNSLFTRILVI